MRRKQTRKIGHQENPASKLTNPLEMVKKKQFRLLNRSILMYELGVRLKLRFWPRWGGNWNEKSDFKEFIFWALEPLRNGKKNNSGVWIALFRCLSWELGPNYDFGPRWARNKRKKSDIKEFSFWAHEPLRNGKKTIQTFESLNSEVRAWS